jgi:hypothetical protein
MKKIPVLFILLIPSIITGILSCDAGKIFSQPDLPPKLEATAQDSYTVTATNPQEVRFGINSNVPWTIGSSEAWCTVSPSMSASSSLVADITVTVARNEATTPRTAKLTITGEGVASQEVTILQDGKGLLEVSAISETDLFPASGGSQPFYITSNKNWTAYASETWLTLEPASGAGSDDNVTVTVSAAPNKTTKRTAKITVKNGLEEFSFNVVQDGILFSLDKTEGVAFNGSTEFEEYELTANIGWTAAVVSGDDWLSLSQTSGNASASIRVNAANNTTLKTRTGQVVISPTGFDNINPVVLDFTQDIMQDGTTRIDFSKGNYGGFYLPSTSSVQKTDKGLRISMDEDGGGWNRIRYEDYTQYFLGIYTWKFASVNLPSNSGTFFDLNAWGDGAGNYHLYLNNLDKRYLEIGGGFGWADASLTGVRDFNLANLKTLTVKVDYDPANAGKVKVEVFFNGEKAGEVLAERNPYPGASGPNFYVGLLYEGAGEDFHGDVTIEYFQKTPIALQ